MQWVVAVLGSIAAVAIVYQLAKNVGTATSATTGLGTISSGVTSVVGSLFSK